MKLIASGTVALLIFIYPEILKAQDKPNGKSTVANGATIAHKPRPPLFPTTDQWDTSSVGPLTMEKRIRLSPFNPLAHPQYKLGIMLQIPKTKVSFVPVFQPCQKLKNAPPGLDRCKQIGLKAKIDLNRKRENLNPGGKNGSFK